MSEFDSIAPIRQSIEGEMGSVLSKITRPFVIDLTKDDDDDPPTRQQPLPPFSGLFTNGSHAISARPGLSPLAHSRASWPTNPAFGEGQEPHLHQHPGPTAPAKEPGIGSHEYPPRTPPNQTKDRKRKAIPGDVEVIDLISPDHSPEPVDHGAAPATQYGAKSDAMRDRLQAPLSPRKRVKRNGPPRPAPAFKTLRTGMTLRSHTKADRLAASGESFQNPIEILDDPIQVPAQLPVPALPRGPVPAEHNVSAENLLVLFSDGSYIQRQWGGCGVAYWKDGHWSGKAIALGNVLGESLEAEAEGIAEALKVAAQLLRPNHKVVEIRTDCLALVDSFRALVHDGAYRYMQNARREHMSLMRRGIHVKLTWVKGHAGDAGNEMADRLAGMGSRRSAQGFAGDTWENPDLSDVLVGGWKMSSKAENVSGQMREMAQAREFNRTMVRAQRRAKKLELRAQRAKGGESSTPHLNYN